MASTKNGQDMSVSMINVKGKPKLNFQSQLPKEMTDGIRKIVEMEDSFKKY